MAERLPLQGRRVVEVLATSTGGVGTDVRPVLAALVAGALGADPVPGGDLLATIGAGVLAAAAALAVATAVMMGTARGPLLAAVRGLRRGAPQEVHGG